MGIKRRRRCKAIEADSRAGRALIASLGLAPALSFPADAISGAHPRPFFRLSPFTPIVVESGKPAFFCPLPFLGHCFGLISSSGSLAASAFPVPPLHHWVPSDKAAARFGSSSPRFWVPQKMGQKKETFSCPTYELSNGRRICWSRSRAASSAEQRFKIHRSFRRYTTLLEKRR